jgi:hypothetical protein
MMARALFATEIVRPAPRLQCRVGLPNPIAAAASPAPGSGSRVRRRVRPRVPSTLLEAENTLKRLANGSSAQAADALTNPR